MNNIEQFYHWKFNQLKTKNFKEIEAHFWYCWKVLNEEVLRRWFCNFRGVGANWNSRNLSHGNSIIIQNSNSITCVIVQTCTKWQMSSYVWCKLLCPQLVSWNLHNAKLISKIYHYAITHLTTLTQNTKFSKDELVGKAHSQVHYQNKSHSRAAPNSGKAPIQGPWQHQILVMRPSEGLTVHNDCVNSHWSHNEKSTSPYENVRACPES